MLSAAGRLGKPGITITSPVRHTRNPAPLATRISVTLIVKPVGAPNRADYQTRNIAFLPYKQVDYQGPILLIERFVFSPLPQM